MRTDGHREACLGGQPAAIRGAYRQRNRSLSTGVRRPDETIRRGIEIEPGRQGISVGKCDGVGQFVANIGIGKRVRRQAPEERQVLGGILVRGWSKHDRRRIAAVDAQREPGGNAVAGAVRGNQTNIEFTAIARARHTAEAQGFRVEAQPTRQRRSIRLHGPIAERVAGPLIGIPEEVRIHGKLECLAGHGGLRLDFILQHRRVAPELRQKLVPRPGRTIGKLDSGQ